MNLNDFIDAHYEYNLNFSEIKIKKDKLYLELSIIDDEMLFNTIFAHWLTNNNPPKKFKKYNHQDFKILIIKHVLLNIIRKHLKLSKISIKESEQIIKKSYEKQINIQLDSCEDCGSTNVFINNKEAVRTCQDCGHQMLLALNANNIEYNYQLGDGSENKSAHSYKVKRLVDLYKVPTFIETQLYTMNPNSTTKEIKQEIVKLIYKFNPEKYKTTNEKKDLLEDYGLKTSVFLFEDKKYDIRIYIKAVRSLVGGKDIDELYINEYFKDNNKKGTGLPMSSSNMAKKFIKQNEKIILKIIKKDT